VSSKKKKIPLEFDDLFKTFLKIQNNRIMSKNIISITFFFVC